jgi:hypothetical protein
VAAEQVANYLEPVPIGSSLAIDSSAPLCAILELLVPEVLRRSNPEWQEESIDGFFFSSAIKTGDASAELVGTCILISDQTVTPFALSIHVSDRHQLDALRIRLGEPGTGPLRISGPACNSRAARTMLMTLNQRVERVHWVYDVAVGSAP